MLKLAYENNGNINPYMPDSINQAEFLVEAGLLEPHPYWPKGNYVLTQLGEAYWLGFADAYTAYVVHWSSNPDNPMMASGNGKVLIWAHDKAGARMRAKMEVQRTIYWSFTANDILIGEIAEDRVR